MHSALTEEVDRLAVRLNILATVGSVAPFVGLFGTVWGIMRSFSDIAGAQSTSLAVVAPGIAEALFATALGLFAAIPAVIAYNRFSYGINRLEAGLQRFADGPRTRSRELRSRARMAWAHSRAGPARAASPCRKSTSRDGDLSWCCGNLHGHRALLTPASR